MKTISMELDLYFKERDETFRKGEEMGMWKAHGYLLNKEGYSLEEYRFEKAFLDEIKSLIPR